MADTPARGAASLASEHLRGAIADRTCVVARARGGCAESAAGPAFARRCNRRQDPRIERARRFPGGLAVSPSHPPYCVVVWTGIFMIRFDNVVSALFCSRPALIRKEAVCTEAQGLRFSSRSFSRRSRCSFWRRRRSRRRPSKRRSRNSISKNGMKWLVVERHEAPVAFCAVAFNVGAANEWPNVTGISHMLEHMRFKGTEMMGTKNFKKEAPYFEQTDALGDKTIALRKEMGEWRFTRFQAFGRQVIESFSKEEKERIGAEQERAEQAARREDPRHGEAPRFHRRGSVPRRGRRRQLSGQVSRVRARVGRDREAPRRAARVHGEGRALGPVHEQRLPVPQRLHVERYDRLPRISPGEPARALHGPRVRPDGIADIQGVLVGARRHHGGAPSQRERSRRSAGRIVLLGRVHGEPVQVARRRLDERSPDDRPQGAPEIPRYVLLPEQRHRRSSSAT